MSERVTFFLLLVLLGGGCGGQRSFTYKLRHPQNRDQYSTLHSMPGGALLMVSKRLEHPQRTWNLVRIAGWDTSQPQEDKLDVDVGPNEELFGQVNWTSQGDGFDRNDQLLMDPGGNYLVVRLSPDASSWNTDPDKHANPRAVLNIVDLHGFKLLRRVELDDPLLAAGDMGFSPKGTFMVSGFQEHSSATVARGVTRTRQYAVETLALPGLEAKTVCNYTMVETTYSAQSASTPEEKAQIERENEEEYEREQNEKRAADAACRPALAPLDFRSLNDVHEALNLDGRLKHNLDYTTHVPPQSPWGCNIEDLSVNLQYEMFDCDQSRVVVFGGYRAFRVFHLEDGKQIMELRLPPSHPWFGSYRKVFGVLATTRGVTYVVLLRDGAELQGYRVP